MKKNIIAIVSFLIFLLIANTILILNIGFDVPNNTILLSSSDGKYTLYTLSDAKEINDFLNEKILSLNSCYDESYYYSKEHDNTIRSYTSKKEFIGNIINIEIIIGNYCKDEYVLPSDYLTKFNDAVIGDADIMYCNNGHCNSSALEASIKETIIDKLSTGEIVENKTNFGADSDYVISIYYALDNSLYTMNVFNYNDYVAIKVIDQNDHSKNLLFSGVEFPFKNIYESN